MPEITDPQGRRLGYVKEPPFDRTDIDQILTLHPHDSLVAVLARQLEDFIVEQPGEKALHAAYIEGEDSADAETKKYIEEMLENPPFDPDLRPGELTLYRSGHDAACKEILEKLKTGPTTCR